MLNRHTDIIFQLIKSLSKAEKRNFKLFSKRNSSAENLKIIILFDAIDKQKNYDEELIITKHKTLKKQQLSNLKAHLYKQILASLRIIESNDNIDIVLNEQMDFARILYNKGLYYQSLKILSKLKELAKKHYQYSFQFQALQFEKKIEALHITRSISNRAKDLSNESNEVSKSLSSISQLSNLALEMYGWYIQNGHARDKKDEQMLTAFFSNAIQNIQINEDSFYDKLYAYQSHCWYGFIRQDILMYYRYTQKWVDLFEENPLLKTIETGQYIRALHNLLNAQYNLGNYEKYLVTLEKFEHFYTIQKKEGSLNSIIQAFVYLHIDKINKHFLEGSFDKGLKLVPIIESNLKEFSFQLDNHKVLIFYYKIACLHFGSGNNDKAIYYLNKIIQLKVDLRTDLQCYARLLHLIAHYELGNFQLIEYLIKSVYRFMSKLNNLSVVEEAIFGFLRKAFALSPTSKKLMPAFEDLKNKLLKLQHKKVETRSFMYLDIIAWLESKIENIPVQKIVQRNWQKGFKVHD